MVHLKDSLSEFNVVILNLFNKFLGIVPGLTWDGICA